jgi:membrane glycosyltransferase
VAARRQGLIEKALRDGPTSLRPEERIELLSDPAAFNELHQRVWELPGGDAARRWGISS